MSQNHINLQKLQHVNQVQIGSVKLLNFLGQTKKDSARKTATASSGAGEVTVRYVGCVSGVSNYTQCTALGGAFSFHFT